MDANHLCSSKGAPAPHLVIQERFCQPEDALIARDMVHLDMFLDLIYQEGRCRYQPVRFRSLRAGYDVPALYALVGLVDGNGTLLEAEVLRSERQELSFANARPVQDFESKKRKRLVHNLSAKCQVLVTRPELHLDGTLVGSDLARTKQRIVG